MLNRLFSLKIGHLADLNKIWWGRIGQVLTLYREDLRTKLDDEYVIIKYEDS